VRTLTREKGKVTCELSASRPISVPGSRVGREMLHPATLDPRVLRNYYGVHPLGDARVAGKVYATGRGHTPGSSTLWVCFYLGRESGLPLRSDLMGQQTTPIEQVMFTSLNLLQSQGPVSGVGPVPPQSGYRPKRPVLDLLPWRFDALPPGFVLVMHADWRDGGGQPVDHFVLSNGLASLSVYVEGSPRGVLEGGTRIGAVHAVGKRVSDHQVTVIGEVPLETVETVLAGIRHVPGRRR